MIYDGGMRCTYCGDIDPLDTGEFSEEEESETDMEDRYWQEEAEAIIE